jgi:hypothetical protein
MSLQEAMAILVPVCVDLQARHANGDRLYVHPSCIVPHLDGLARVAPELAVVPTQHRDRYCLAPEQLRALEPGDACSSVFSLGAILYEMLTGLHVGPGMKRPRDIDPALPETIEVLIGKAIIGDRTHRPSDLGALGSAMYALAPLPSIHPPEASPSQFDESAELAIDVRLSMLPPTEQATAGSGAAMPRPARLPEFGAASGTVRTQGATGGDPFAAPVIDVHAARLARAAAADPTAKLSALKARLESDPRPRYVVSKDRMDHGPFSAVELLQQIATHAFTSDDDLRDEISGQVMAIGQWEEFAPFAEHAMLVRERRAEEKAVVRAAKADQRDGVAKSIVAVSVVVALAGVLAVWFFTSRGLQKDSVVVANDRTGTIEVNGDIKGKNKKTASAGGGGGHAGYSGGRSYESVLENNNETISIGAGGSATPDLTNAQLSAPLRHASFISGCGAPDDMKVTVRVAVKMGRPLGVTVTTSPANAGVAACIDRSVRGLQWPPSAKTDFVTTTY